MKLFTRTLIVLAAAAAFTFTACSDADAPFEDLAKQAQADAKDALGDDGKADVKKAAEADGITIKYDEEDEEDEDDEEEDGADEEESEEE